MIRLPPRSTRTDTLFPYTTLFRSFHVNEDGSKLQKLTPQQVANRLAAYNADGSFEADLGALWRDAGGVLGPVIEEHAGEELAGAFRERCTGDRKSTRLNSNQ